MGIPFYIAQLGEVRFACICDRSGAESCNCVFNLAGQLQKFQVPSICNNNNYYLLCFSKTQPLSQLHFSLPSIITTITSNEPRNTGTHKTDRNSPITNHKPWPFEPVLFPERSSKMIDGSEKCKHQLTFEIWNSRVFEKCSNRQCIEQLVLFSSCFLSK